MINVYGYPFFVLLSFLLIYIGVIKIIKFAGMKIKTFSIVIFCLLIFRYLSLAILMTSSNIIFLYILKPFFYSNYLSIPILSMVAIYIIMRDDKFQFKNIIVISLILSLLYLIMLGFLPNNIESSSYYGYKMYLQNPEFIYLFTVAINTFFLIFSVKLLDKSHLDRKGIYLIIVASTVAILGSVLTVLGIRIFQENIISDLCWMVVFIYALGKLKK